jgi:hypothetical protein
VAHAWKRVTFWGIGLSFPIPPFLVQDVSERQIAVFRKFKTEIADCPRCHRLFGARAGMSFILHLQDAHHMDSYESMDTVAHLYRILIAHRDEEIDIALPETSCPQVSDEQSNSLAGAVCSEQGALVLPEATLS